MTVTRSSKLPAGLHSHRQSAVEQIDHGYAIWQSKSIHQHPLWIHWCQPNSMRVPMIRSGFCFMSSRVQSIGSSSSRIDETKRRASRWSIFMRLINWSIQIACVNLRGFGRLGAGEPKACSEWNDDDDDYLIGGGRNGKSCARNTWSNCHLMKSQLSLACEIAWDQKEESHRHKKASQVKQLARVDDDDDSVPFYWLDSSIDPHEAS